MDPVTNRVFPQYGFGDTSKPSQQASALEKKIESVSSQEFEKMEHLSKAVSALKIARTSEQSEKLARGLDFLFHAPNSYHSNKEIVSTLFSLFADADLPDWPADSAQQKLYILDFIENLATNRLRQVLQERPKLPRYYESLSHLAFLYSLLSSLNYEEISLLPYVRRFDKHIGSFYPQRYVAENALIKVFTLSQKLLKKVVEGEQVNTVNITYRTRNYTAYMFEGLAWSIEKDKRMRICGLSVYRLADEDSETPLVSLLTQFNHPWSEERSVYQISELGKENHTYWNERIDTLLARIAGCDKSQPSADKERLIGLFTYATSRFLLWGSHTGDVLSFQAKLLSSILGAKPPVASPHFYEQTLVHSEKSFCDSVYLPAIQGQAAPALPKKLTYDPKPEFEVGDFFSQPNPKLKEVLKRLPIFVGEDYQQAEITFQAFVKEENPYKALPYIQVWLSTLLATRRELDCAPELLMQFVITPLFQSILTHLEKQGEDALDFLSSYVPDPAPITRHRGHAQRDQRIFALYSHMTALVAKMRLLPFNNKGMEKNQWEEFLDWLGLQQCLIQWLMNTKYHDTFGERRSKDADTTFFTELTSHWREFNEKRALRFYERLKQEPPPVRMPIRIPNNGILVDDNAYIFEGLAWLPKVHRLHKPHKKVKHTIYDALVLDDFNPAKGAVVGTSILSSQFIGEYIGWKHGDETYWEEQYFQLFNKVLCKNNINKLPQTLGHLAHTHAQFARYRSGTAAIGNIIDVAMRMVKELPIPKAKKDLDCYAFSMSARDFVDTVYLQQHNTEETLSLYQNGYNIPKSAYIPPNGFYARNDLYHQASERI
ncbi:MAG: hypothetical protein JSR37_03660 [Verrucomicrobia bacterium]|nr:hypothetical protein [Verrucomicrobiota bacterium]MBS0637149.1 hypothetical protein [Verrucomicrobiota bacterium]